MTGSGSDTRREPEMAADERTTLVGFLAYYRDTLALKASGLDDAQAATAAVEPSMLSLVGLVRHMAEVERHWFRRVFDDEDAPPIYYSPERPDGDLEVLPTTSLDESIAVWRAEVAAADLVLTGVADLAQVAAREAHDSPVSMRWILVHMIEEYARHAGHADLIRERLDGTTGD